MKTLVISDVHSNIIALDAVWKEESDVDMILFIGDVVDCGVYPRECVDWMMDKDVRAVAGNHDLGVIEAYEAPEEAAMSWRGQNAQKLDAHHIAYLKSLPEQLVVDVDGDTYGLTHDYGGNYDVIRSEESFESFSDDRFGRSLHKMIFGHTHRRALSYLSDKYSWLNPGSVSYRRDDEFCRGAHYSVIQDGKVSLRTVPYPTEQLHQEVVASNLHQVVKDMTYHWWGPR